MLKIELKQIDNIVLMKIIEQGDEIKRGCGEFFSTNGFSFVSANRPTLTLNYIGVQGVRKEHDNDYSAIDLETKQNATKFISRVKECISKYNQLLEDLIWKPSQKEKFFYITDGYGGVISTHYNSVYNDKKIIDNFCAFKTKEQAQKVSSREVLMNLLWQLKFSLCPDVDYNCDLKYTIIYNPKSKTFSTFLYTKNDFLTPIFNKDSADKAVKYLNEHKELWNSLV